MELGTQCHGVDHDGLLLGVIVEDAVLAGAIGDLHYDKVALSGPRVKVTLSAGVSLGRDGSGFFALSRASREDREEHRDIAVVVRVAMD